MSTDATTAAVPGQEPEPETRTPYRLPYVGGLPRKIRQALDAVGGRGRNTLRAAVETVDAFCRKHGSDRVFISNRTIAAEIGVSQAHVSRLLDALERIVLPDEGIPVLAELGATRGSLRQSLPDRRPDTTSPTGRWIVLPWFKPRPAPSEPVGERPPIRVRQRSGHYVCASADAFSEGERKNSYRGRRRGLKEAPIAPDGRGGIHPGATRDKLAELYSIRRARAA